MEIDASNRPQGRRRPASTLIAAAVIMAAITAAFAWPAFEALRPAAGSDRSAPLGRRLAEYTVQTGQDASAVVPLFGALMLALCVLYLVLAVGTVARRRWARDSAMVVCGFLGVVAAGVSVAGLVGGADDALNGILAGLANLAVVGLLLAPRAADDVATAEHARLHERAMRRAIRSSRAG